MARRMRIAITMGLFIGMQVSAAATDTSKRTPQPTENTRVFLRYPVDSYSIGTVGPTIAVSEAAENVPVIGGPETITPEAEATKTIQVSTADPTKTIQVSTPDPTKTPYSSPVPTSTPKPSNITKSDNGSSSSSVPQTSKTTLTQLPTTSVKPTSTSLAPTDSPSSSPTTPPTPTEQITLPPQPQSPQAIDVTVARNETSWVIIAVVSGIAAAAMLIALVLWRGTRFPNRHTRTSESFPNNTSGDLDHDWYSSSPNPSSNDASIDTFMGREPERDHSDVHTSSRATSTADLLNVSTVGDRSTTSDPSNESREQSNVEIVSNDGSNRTPGGLFRHCVDLRERSSSSPHVSFGDEVNALSDSGSGLQAIFVEHYQTFVQSQPNSTAYPTSGGAAFSPTSTNDVLTSEIGDSSSDEEDDEYTLRRSSNGSMNSAFQPSSDANFDDSSYIPSTRSDWSTFSIGTSECGSIQSLE